MQRNATHRATQRNAALHNVMSIAYFIPHAEYAIRYMGQQTSDLYEMVQILLSIYKFLCQPMKLVNDNGHIDAAAAAAAVVR